MGNLQFFSMGNSSSTPSTTSSSSTPSSTTTHRKKHDVFISFRGEDTRHGFISHLNDALRRKNIETFIDDRLVKGDEIWPGLIEAIKVSKISVIVFSKDYASSKWCLRELAEIMKRKKMNEQIVMSIFYQVVPSDVRKQTGSVKDSFAKHRKENQEEVQKWRETLTEASNLSGWDSSVTRPESKLVREIVDDIWRKLMSEHISSSSDFEGLIGIYKRVERILSLLCLDTMDFRIIGIWGMGGIGKTTVADAVFKLISGQFEGHCFIQNVREKSKNGVGLECLQHEFLSKVLEHEYLKLGTPTIPPFIKERLNWKKVLIVLDDVNNSIQLENLVGGLNRSSLGSRIIITSRDKQVLYNCGVNDHNIYKVEGFDDDEALELFCNYAFQQNHPTEDLTVLSGNIVNCARGNPLALKVLGSCLYGKGKQEWESALKKLQANIKFEIFDVLKISYDGLDEEEKSLFLDIACFYYIFYDGQIAELLDCKYSLSVLVAKSLITLEGSRIDMHGLLLEMGREIVRRESPNKPGNRSRLWKEEDIIRTLKNDNGTDTVEGIILNMDNQKEIHLSSQVFDKMHNLRYLIFEFCTVHLPNGLNYLPDELRILEWHRYPLKVLSSDFNPEKLVRLDLHDSNIEQLWEGIKHASNLKWLFLNDCPHLTSIPDLLYFPLLEEAQIQRCKSLRALSSSVQHLNHLLHLDMSDCINLTKFPLISGNIESLCLRGTAIEEVPSSIQSLIKLTQLDLSKCTRLKHISTGICKLKSLETLHLDDCSELETFPEILETMEFLSSLHLDGTAIKELPPSIEHLNGLEYLHMSCCKNLEMLPSSICNLRSLRHLNLSNCSKLDKLPEKFGNLKSLKQLKVNGNMFESLPKSIKQLSNLEFLYLSDCNMLQSLTELPSGLHNLDAMNCKQLCQALPDPSEFASFINGGGYFTFSFTNCLELNYKAISNVFGESLLLLQHTEKGSEKPSIRVDLIFPGSEIPEWFSCRSRGSSINIQVPRYNLINRKYMGFALCAVMGSEEYFLVERGFFVNVCYHFETSDVPTEKYGGSFLLSVCYRQEIEHKISIDTDHILLGYISFSTFDSLSEELEKLLACDSDYVNMSFEFRATLPIEHDYKVKCCAIHPIHEL